MKFSTSSRRVCIASKAALSLIALGGLGVGWPGAAWGARGPVAAHPVIARPAAAPQNIQGLRSAHPALWQNRGHAQYPSYGHVSTGQGRFSSSSQLEQRRLGSYGATRLPSVVHQLPVRPESSHLATIVHPLADSHFLGNRSVAGMRDGRIAAPAFYRGVSSYHAAHYHAAVVDRFARYPRLYNGYWSGGWYHGYWRSYWIAEPWVTFAGYYGFWLAVGGVSTFVYESGPGVCSYWNGVVWVAWYNPPYTPYYCPY